MLYSHIGTNFLFFHQDSLMSRKCLSFLLYMESVSTQYHVFSNIDLIVQLFVLLQTYIDNIFRITIRMKCCIVLSVLVTVLVVLSVEWLLPVLFPVDISAGYCHC